MIGPFEVERKLGEGAMGVVFEGLDRKLNRRVALKLVRRQLLNNAAVRERMNREAQAMACLSSPFVVQVYQVGEHDGGIYVAMEYVDGQTLGTWLKEQPRPWQQVLRVLCDAGRGLAAAHAEGLVHRDFKPDNVLVDEHGRARVLDFGLVHSETALPGSGDDLLAVTEPGESPTTYPGLPVGVAIDRSNIHWSVRLTQIGNVLGTPAYMSPEQHFGRPAGPYSDQFSFAITLYEALYGARPFNGDSWESIRMQVHAGLVPPPPLDSPVPRRIYKVIARALATAPDERWPSLAAMLDALENDPWRARVRIAGMVGLIGATAVTSYSLALTRVDGEQRCQVDAQALADAWDPARKAAVARAFDATHAPFAADTWKRVEKGLDAYAQAWTRARQEVCEAHEAGLQTSHLTELRIACLGRRKTRLSALVEVFAAADRAVLENAVQAVASLPSMQACDDADALLRLAAPPDDPRTAARVEALQVQLERAAALETTARYEQGLQLTGQAREEARVLGYAPLEAEAALVEGRLQMFRGQQAEAEAALQQAVRIGIVQDQHALAAEAAAARMFALGVGLGRHGEALAAEPFVAALIERAGDEGDLTALLHNNLGAVHHARGDFEAARSHFERTIASQERRADDGDPLVAITRLNLATMFLDADQLVAAGLHYERALELFVQILGEGHPLVAHATAGLADVDERRGARADAHAKYTHALAIMEDAYGPTNLYLTHPLVGLGRVEAADGQVEAARRHFARAVEIGEALAVEHPYVGEALAGLADIAAAEGATQRARALFERAAAMFAAAGGAEADKGAHASLRAGELAGELGDRAGAEALFERILAEQSGAKEVRARAALRLAAALADRGADARACALAREGRAGLPDGDRRRVEADDLAARACPKG